MLFVGFSVCKKFGKSWQFLRVAAPPCIPHYVAVCHTSAALVAIRLHKNIHSSAATVME
jgi:hypothetical protein